MRDFGYLCKAGLAIAVILILNYQIFLTYITAKESVSSIERLKSYIQAKDSQADKQFQQQRITTLPQETQVQITPSPSISIPIVTQNHIPKDKLTISVLVMATGKYIRFARAQMAEMDKLFMPETNLHLVYFTDGEVPYINSQRTKVSRVYQQRLGWPKVIGLFI